MAERKSQCASDHCYEACESFAMIELPEQGSPPVLVGMSKIFFPTGACRQQRENSAVRKKRDYSASRAVSRKLHILD
jgi:hypothetical protein